MKNIAVFVSDFIIEHCQEFIRGVLDYYDTKNDVTVFVTQTQFSRDSLGVFDYQFWSGAEILKSKQIDGYIFLSSVYCSIWNKQILKELAASFGNRPVVSASIDLENKNTYAVINNCEKSYLSIISHLKNQHGCKKFAFMSANSTDSPEAVERFNSFKKALAENQLEFDESLVFDGHFDEHYAEAVLREKIKSKEDLTFDALVCASDLMAVGSIKALGLAGISVPEDVKIVGFDDAIFASLSTPKISTINQNILGQGQRCAEIAYKAVCGEKMEHLTYSDLNMIYRQSCGCVPKTNQNLVYVNENNQLCNENSIRGNLLDMYLNEIQEKYKYASLLDLLKAANTLKQFYFNLNYIVDVAMLNDMAICLYDEPLYINRNEKCDIPSKAEMVMYSTRSQEGKVFKPSILFNPHETICPIDSIRKEKGTYIVYPVFSGEANYGYLVAKPKKNNFGAYTINIKILITSIASAVEYTNNITQKQLLTFQNNELVEENSSLNVQSRTDELTSIHNRRGFMELGQRNIDVMQEMNTNCLVFYADMDGLKKINDTYGHEMGDIAIRLQAEVLKKAFGSTDIIGRLGGDEFGIVANNLTLENVPEIRERIKNLCSEISVQNNLPFTLSISLGVVNLYSSSILPRLLTEADKFLYEEKRQKKEKKSQNQSKQMSVE